MMKPIHSLKSLNFIKFYLKKKKFNIKCNFKEIHTCLVVGKEIKIKNKSNKQNKPNKSNKLNKLNKQNKPNKLNKKNKPNKINL